MKKTLQLLYIASIGLLTLNFSSCCCQKKAGSTSDTSKNQSIPDYEKEGYAKATVVIYKVDGCNYMLQLASGKKLEVQGLPEELKKENQQTWIKYVPDKTAISICMAGEIVKLTDYKVIK